MAINNVEQFKPDTTESAKDSTARESWSSTAAEIWSAQSDYFTNKSSANDLVAYAQPAADNAAKAPGKDAAKAKSTGDSGTAFGEETKPIKLVEGEYVRNDVKAWRNSENPETSGVVHSKNAVSIHGETVDGADTSKTVVGKFDVESGKASKVFGAVDYTEAHGDKPMQMDFTLADGNKIPFEKLTPEAQKLVKDYFSMRESQDKPGTKDDGSAENVYQKAIENTLGVKGVKPDTKFSEDPKVDMQLKVLFLGFAKNDANAHLSHPRERSFGAVNGGGDKIGQFIQDSIEMTKLPYKFAKHITDNINEAFENATSGRR